MAVNFVLVGNVVDQQEGIADGVVLHVGTLMAVQSVAQHLVVERVVCAQAVQFVFVGIGHVNPLVLTVAERGLFNHTVGFLVSRVVRAGDGSTPLVQKKDETVVTPHICVRGYDPVRWHSLRIPNM